MRAILAAGRQEGDELVSTFWCVASGCNHVRAEMLRENKRMLDKAIRELDRERMSLQQQEKKTIVEIKKMAKEGQMVRCAAWLAKPPPLAPTPPPVPAAKFGQLTLLPVCVWLCLCVLCTTKQDAVKVMAKSLIRNRHAVTKLHALKSQLQAVSLRIQVCCVQSASSPCACLLGGSPAPADS